MWLAKQSSNSTGTFTYLYVVNVQALQTRVCEHFKAWCFFNSAKSVKIKVTQQQLFIELLQKAISHSNTDGTELLKNCSNM